MNEVFFHQFEQGLILVGEPMRSVQSVSLSMLTPGGVVHEPEDQLGLTAVLSDMLSRGAGELDSRAHAEALDALGVMRHQTNSLFHTSLGATLLGDRLKEALPLVVDMVRSPILPESELDACRELALQEIASLADEPQRRVFEELGRLHEPTPMNRSMLGRADTIGRLTIDDLRGFAEHSLVPDRSILAVAGRMEFDRVVEQVGSLLERWSGRADPLPEFGESLGGYHHEEDGSAQIHIGLAHDAPNRLSPDSVLERYVSAVLSGGMSGRLFTEVREKRGLCYAVGARYSASRFIGSVLLYAGTRPERAQETLDVILAELSRLRKGIQEDEFERARVGMKSSVVMNGESTSARAASLASDQFTYDRTRTLAERLEEIEAVTLDQVNDYLARQPARPLTVVTIGPKTLKLPDVMEVA